MPAALLNLVPVVADGSAGPRRCSHWRTALCYYVVYNTVLYGSAREAQPTAPRLPHVRTPACTFPQRLSIVTIQYRRVKMTSPPGASRAEQLQRRRRGDRGRPHAAHLRHRPGRPGRLGTLSVFLCKSFLCGAFVWARRALNSRKWRFPARAGRGPPRGRDWGSAATSLCTTYSSASYQIF
jgi:hypothetical protein